MVNPYSPLEPQSVIDLEHADFAGIVLSSMGYGISAMYFFRCMTILLNKKNRREMHNLYLAGYVFVLFAMGTLFIALNTRVQQLAFIDNRNFPAGPIGYVFSIYGSPLVVAPNACFVIANWMADGLLLYRCYVIYSAKRWVIAFPMVIYMGSISMGVTLIYQTARPLANIFTKVNFGLPYFSISTGLNVILTLMISARLLLHRRKLQGLMGPDSGASSPYTSIVTMLVESSALYAVFSLLLIGPYAAGHYSADIFLPLLSQVQIIAPMLIILRVADKRSWTSKTASTTAAASSSIAYKARITGGSSTAASGNEVSMVMFKDNSQHELSKQPSMAFEHAV